MNLSTDAKRTATMLSIGRATIGSTALLMPAVGARLFGFPRADITPTAVFMTRLLGVRDIAIAAANLVWLSEREPTRALAALNAAVDGGDALVALAGLARRRQPALALALAAAAAVPVAALWCRLAMSLEEAQPAP